MKKIAKAIVILVLVSIYSLIIEGCLCPPEDLKIIGLEEIEVASWIDSTYVRTDTIYGIFYLITTTESEIAFNPIQDLSLMSSAYAISCDPDNYLNTLEESSFKLTCDTDFVYDNQIISAGTDYAQTEELEVRISPPYDYGGAEIQVIFGEDFMNKAEFQNTDYTFKIEIETDDGLNLMAEKILIMNL